MKRLAAIFMTLLIPVLAVSAQEALPVITLSQSIDAALANGDDNKILQGNLNVARAQHALNVSKNSFTLGGSAGLGYNYPYGDLATLSAKSSTASSAGSSLQGAQVGLGLSGPLTNVNLNASPFTPNVGKTVDNASSIGVIVSQTLWNGYPGGSTQATVDKSLLALQGKELSTDAGRLSLIYSVKQAYYAQLSAQRNLDLKRQIFEKQDAVLKQITAIYDLKLASTADLKTAQLNARSAQVDVDGAMHDLRFARITLATYMGLAPDKEFTVADAQDPTVPATTMEEAVSAGLSRRVEIKQIEISIKSANIDLAVAKGLATPTVSVSGGANAILDWSSGKTAGTANAGVKLAMPILDAGGVQNQVDAIRRQNDVYATQESQLQKSIATAIRNGWEGVQLADEKLELAQLAVEATDLQYKLVSAQRDSGTASNQDLLTAAVNLANAQNALQAARSAAQLAVLQLQSLMGY